MDRLLACLGTALVLAVAGCGGSDSGGSDKQPASGDSGSKGSSDAGTQVDMKDIQFAPMDITVKKGQTVTWTNSDSVPHNVTKENGPGADFKPSNLDGGATYKHTFDSAGKFDYVCTIHPNQTGSVTVR